MTELMGKAEGYCYGLGGSMHIADFERRILGANGIVGAGMGLGTGAALAEKLNGSGYPEGRSGEDIPLEARIVAVADIFDALTSRRVYKEAWSNGEAIEELKKLAGEKLDRDCVDALISNLEQVERIQRQFSEDFYG